MFGEPFDKEGECNALLFISDNHGDNHATIRCQLVPDHDGLHSEVFDRDGGPVTITWITNERTKCDHGCGQWDHDHRDANITCPKDADDHEYSDCTYCHPGEDGMTCTECDKTYYDDEHKQHCPGQTFACTDCGENGVGYHVCPRSSDGSFDESSENP